AAPAAGRRGGLARGPPGPRAEPGVAARLALPAALVRRDGVLPARPLPGIPPGLAGPGAPGRGQPLRSAGHARPAARRVRRVPSGGAAPAGARDRAPRAGGGLPGSGLAGRAAVMAWCLAGAWPARPGAGPPAAGWLPGRRPVSARTPDGTVRARAAYAPAGARPAPGSGAADRPETRRPGH